jgi:hypothetical protein
VALGLGEFDAVILGELETDDEALAEPVPLGVAVSELEAVKELDGLTDGVAVILPELDTLAVPLADCELVIETDAVTLELCSRARTQGTDRP